MSDEQKNLKIGIETVATGDGAQKAAQDLEGVKKATDKAKDANKEHEKGWHGINLEMGENRRVMRDLTEAFGPLIEVARAFMNPFIGSITIAIGLFAKFRESLAHWNEEMNKTIEIQAEAEFLPGIEAKHEKLVKLNEEFEKYLDGVEHQISQQQTLNTALEQENAIRAAIAAAKAKVEGAQTNAAEAGIDADLAAWRITAVQAAARKASLKVGSNRATEDAESLKDQQAIDDLERRKTQAQDPKIKSDLAAAEAAVKAQQPDIDSAKSAFEKEKERIKGLDKTALDAQKDLEDRQWQADRLGLGNLLAQRDAFLGSLPARAETAKSEAEQARANIVKGGKLYEANENADTTSAPLERAEKANTDAELFLKEFPDKLATAMATANAREKGSAGAGGSDATAALLKLIAGNRNTNLGDGVTLGFIDAVANVQSHAANHEKLTQSQQQIAHAYADLMNNQIRHNSVIYNLILQLVSAHVDAATKLNLINRELDALKRPTFNPNAYSPSVQ